MVQSNMELSEEDIQTAEEAYCQALEQRQQQFLKRKKKWEGAAANTHKLLIDSFDSLKAPVVRKFCSTREREFSVLVFAEMTSGSAAN